MSMRATGSRIVKRVRPKLGTRVAFGSRLAGCGIRRREGFAAARDGEGCSGCLDRHPARGSRANSGPAMMTAGMATSRPSARVMPTFGLEDAIAASGPGWGGRKPCSTDSPARRRDAEGIAGPCAVHRQHHDRDQQHQADLEEHRDADDARR